jgi:hypothetical protein
MIVFVVCGGGVNDSHCLFNSDEPRSVAGVYSTLEAAEKKVIEIRALHQGYWYGEITEHEVKC